MRGNSRFYKSSLLTIAGFLLAFVLMTISCDTGLGESIDLTPPVLKITYPLNGSYAPKNVVIQGTATDDRKLCSVEVKYKYMKNGQVITGSKNASIDGDRWSCGFDFDDNYEVEFEAFAYDALKNGSDTSHDRVMVLIDALDPETSKMSIRRGNYIVRLLPLEDFIKESGRTSQRNSPQNKDYFQNEEFTILSNLNDNYEIEKQDGYSTATIDLYEIDPQTKAETFICSVRADKNKNEYSPEFTITEEILPRADGKVHYIKPVLKVKDAAGNPSIARVDGVFAWEPEYNTPHVTYNSMTNAEGIITVVQGGTIPVTIFDDDELDSIAWGLVKASEFSGIGSVTLTNSTNITEKLRDTSFEVKTEGKEAVPHYVVTKVVDKSTKNGAPRADGTYFKATLIKITNADVPVIIVDSPAENSVPTLTNGKFKIEGKVMDNAALDKIAIAWLPNGNDDISKAQTFFNTYKFDADKTENGITYYKLSTTSSGSGSSYTMPYEKEFDFFNDFNVNGVLHKDNKVFLIAAKDATENITVKTFRLSKFSTVSTFKVEYKEPSGNYTTTQDPIITFQPKNGKFDGTYNIRITPQEQNGIKITNFTVKSDAPGSTEHNSLDPFVIEMIDPVAGAKVNYTIEAVDQLGGIGRANLTVSFSEVGKLQSITCSRKANTIFTEDETIKLQANFSNGVKVTGKPYIQLGYTDFKNKDSTVTASDLRAEYTIGGGSNTLYFEYTVPKGIECTKLTVPLSNTITVPEGAKIDGDIKVTLDATNTINGSNYSIDSIAPYIVDSGYNPAKTGVVTKTSGKVDIVLTFNEPVSKASGTITMQRTAGWYIPPVLSEDVFLKIYNNPKASSYRNTLCSSLAKIPNTLLPKGPYMQYTQGIKQSGGKYVPDLETKYVLAYEYNIADTSGVVQSLREALEKFDYHKTEVDVASAKVKVGTGNDSNKVTITISDSDFIDRLVNGVEYTLSITNEAFRDAAYNYSGELKANDYKFWVGPVATPVIRVNRTSTNVGIESVALPTTTTVKFDCETPGVTLKYGTTAKTATGIAPTADNEPKHTNIDDITTGDFDSINLGSSMPLSGSAQMTGTIGDGSRDTAQKIYIKAQATSTKTGFTQSAVAGEGAFKTALHYVYNKHEELTYGKLTSEWYKEHWVWGIDPNDGTIQDEHWYNEGSGNYEGWHTYAVDGNYKAKLTRIFGSQSPEGASFTAGWPLTANGMENRKDYQVPYAFVENEGKDNEASHSYWISWQLLSPFSLQVLISNRENSFQNPADTETSYGQYIYCANKEGYGIAHYNPGGTYKP